MQILKIFHEFFLQVFDQAHLLHLFSDSLRQSFSQELTQTLTLGLSLGLGLDWGHFQDKKFFIYTSFKDFSLDVFDDSYVFHLVSDSQRLSFFQELTQTLTLGLSLGLGLDWGHFQDKKFFIYTSFKDFSLDVFDDSYVFHLVSDSQRLSFFQELTPTLTLGLSLGLGLGLGLDWGHFQDKKFFIYTSFKDFSLDVFDDSYVFHLVSDSQRLSFFQELTPTLTLGLSLGLGLGLAWGHFRDKKFFILTSFEDFYLEVFDDTHVLHLVSDSQRSSFSQELTPTLTLGLS